MQDLRNTVDPGAVSAPPAASIEPVRLLNQHGGYRVKPWQPFGLFNPGLVARIERFLKAKSEKREDTRFEMFMDRNQRLLGNRSGLVTAG